MFAKTKFRVEANQKGYLYRAGKFERELESGVCSLFNLTRLFRCILLPTTSKLMVVSNQEVLTKDQIALRFSFNVMYRIADGKKMLNNFELSPQKEGAAIIFGELEPIIHNFVQVVLRNRIAERECTEVNENRATIFDDVSTEVQPSLEQYGIEVQQVVLRDITFPKNIQGIFAKLLEAKIRSKVDLENARTVVATSRTLKNASEMMSKDPNMKFMKLLETMLSISAKGKHQFVFGDLGHYLNEHLQNDNSGGTKE